MAVDSTKKTATVTLLAQTADDATTFQGNLAAAAGDELESQVPHYTYMLSIKQLHDSFAQLQKVLSCFQCKSNCDLTVWQTGTFCLTAASTYTSSVQQQIDHAAAFGGCLLASLGSC